MKNTHYIFKRITAVTMLLIMVLLISVSCQEEVVIIQNPPPEESIESTSDLVILMRDMSGNDGTVDDFIDETSCSSIQFPFTVNANGVEVIIDSIDDLLVLQQLIEDNPDNGSIEILFPITIILPDYSTIVIENQEALDAFIASCDPGPNECVDFVYPFSFSVFNLEFELIETVVISNDFELFFFLQDLNDANGNIVSINYPVSLIYDNGITVEATTNIELAAAIEAGPENCEEVVDPENPCPAQLVTDYLLECFWYPRIYDGDVDNPYKYYHFTFSENNGLEMSTSSSFNIDANWEVIEIADETVVVFESNIPLFDPFIGNWNVLACSENELHLENEDGVQMVFSKNCNDDLAQCMGSGLGICDDDLDGFVTVNFNEIIETTAMCIDALEYVITFHETYQEADQLINQLPSPYQTTVAGSQTFYYAIYGLDSQQVEYVSSFEIIAEDCGGGCENPGILTEDLIFYMTFGTGMKDLISGTLADANPLIISEDRGDTVCATEFVEGSIPVVFNNIAQENWIEENGDFTISLWFKMQNDEGGDYEVMFSTGQYQSDGFSFGVYDLNTPLFSAPSTGLSLWDDDWNNEVDNEWTNTDWHHMVITHEGTFTKMYRDGILRNQSDQDINIGGAIDTGYILNAENYRGVLDDLRVYKKALNPNEIDMLFNLESECYDCLD